MVVQRLSCRRPVTALQHGAEATTHAAIRADQLIEAGNVQGVHLRNRVLKAIEELTSTDPDGAVH
jgi:hypothetical protein